MFLTSPLERNIKSRRDLNQKCVEGLSIVAGIKITVIEISPFPPWQTLVKTGPLAQALRAAFFGLERGKYTRPDEKKLNITWRLDGVLCLLNCNLQKCLVFLQTAELLREDGFFVLKKAVQVIHQSILSVI